jgi:Protein of unknown function (DUF3151)
MPELPITESPETRIEEPSGSLDALEAADTDDDVAGVAARYPECLAAWATLGERALQAGRPIEGYAYFRVGYHRGLDRLRKSGWRGSGRVPWSHPGNQGFLRALVGLGHAAETIGEANEADRCRAFAAELAPDLPAADV